MRPHASGSYHWSGAARTIFWCDPAEQLVVVVMTQCLGGRHYRQAVANIVYSSLVDEANGGASRRAQAHTARL